MIQIYSNLCLYCKFDSIFNYRYLEDKNYILALKAGLALRKPGILSIVVDHSLHPYLAGLALEIMKYDFELSCRNIQKAAEGEGLELLTENWGQIPVI